MSATWPIRIGGEYPSTTQGFTKRVVAIDGDTIHMETRFEGRPAYQSAVSAEAFRTIALPEDQSSIPDLVAALKHCGGYLMTARAECQPEWLAGIAEIIAEADAAIAKAEGRV